MPAAINWTPELEEAICDKLAEGEYLTDICELSGFPTYKTVRKYVAESAEFSKRITRASEDQAEYFRWRISKLNDSMNAENWQFVNAQIRNIQWIMGKVKPKAYGDKMQQDVTLEVAVKRVVSDI
jgi:hypothetical protein